MMEKYQSQPMISTSTKPPKIIVESREKNFRHLDVTDDTHKGGVKTENLQLQNQTVKK